jgi:hypothetical protein
MLDAWLKSIVVYRVVRSDTYTGQLHGIHACHDTVYPYDRVTLLDGLCVLVPNLDVRPLMNLNVRWPPGLATLDFLSC